MSQGFDLWSRHIGLTKDGLSEEAMGGGLDELFVSELTTVHILLTNNG